MRRLCVPILCTTALTATCAHADEFSWQLSGGSRESDLGRSVEAESATLAATYFFRPVDDADGPYALAAILGPEQQPRRELQRRQDDRGGARRHGSDSLLLPPPPPSPPVTIVNRAAGRSLSGRHVWRTTGWYAGASLAETDASDAALLPTSSSVQGGDVSSRSLELGKVRGPLDRGRAVARSRGKPRPLARYRCSAFLGFAHSSRRG